MSDDDDFLTLIRSKKAALTPSAGITDEEARELLELEKHANACWPLLFDQLSNAINDINFLFQQEGSDERFDCTRTLDVDYTLHLDKIIILHCQGSEPSGPRATITAHKMATVDVQVNTPGGHTTTTFDMTENERPRWRSLLLQRFKLSMPSDF